MSETLVPYSAPDKDKSITSNEESLIKTVEKSETSKKNSFPIVSKETSLAIKFSKNKEITKLITKEKEENDVLRNIVSVSTQKTYTSYAKSFANFLIENEIYFEDDDKIDILTIVSSFLANYKKEKKITAISTWRGIINGIFFFFSSNNMFLSSNLYNSIKKLEQSYQNIQSFNNKNNLKFQKHAKKIKTEHIIELFSKLGRSNYLEKRNLGVYTLLVIGISRMEQLEKLNYLFVEFLDNDEVKITWKYSKSNQDNAWEHYFILKLPHKFKYIIDNIKYLYSIASKLNKENNQNLFKKTASNMNPTPIQEDIKGKSMVSSLITEIVKIYPNENYDQLSGHSFKKSAIHLLINDMNEPKIPLDVLAFHASWKLNKNEGL
jgi:hypothetical protein